MTLLALIVVPMFGALALYVLPRGRDAAAKWFATAIALAVLADAAGARYAPDVTRQWLARPFTAAFHFGVGPVSYWLLVLLALTTACALLACSVPRARDFAALLLLLEGSMAGVFLARDLLVFALFWDLMLVPVFLALIGWGEHHATAWRYLIYNFIGGLALLLATAAFGIAYGTTDVLGRVGAADFGGAWQPWIFAGLAFAFLVKTPVWPLHTWMPATYADSPPPLVAVLSAVQSKAGLYGFIVIAGPLFARSMHAAASWMIALGLVSLFYGAFVALTQPDVKRIVAYSSLSHLGLILIAIFSFNGIALRGALLYIVAHGLFSAALFLVCGYFEEREGTRVLSRLGGIGAHNPRVAGAFVIAALAALGLPGLAGFSGELLILSGVFAAGLFWVALAALVPIVLAAAYMLRLFQGAMNGPQVADLPQRHDLGWREALAVTPLIAAIIVLGVAPGVIVAAPAAHADAVLR